MKPALHWSLFGSCAVLVTLFSRSALDVAASSLLPPEVRAAERARPANPAGLTQQGAGPVSTELRVVQGAEDESAGDQGPF